MRPTCIEKKRREEKRRGEESGERDDDEDDDDNGHDDDDGGGEERQEGCEAMVFMRIIYSLLGTIDSCSHRNAVVLSSKHTTAVYLVASA
jgi:hypothetical protein